MAQMDYREFLQRREQWEASGNHLMSRDEVDRFDRFFSDTEKSAPCYSEGLTRALAGDFSQFELVDPMLKGYLGARKCYDLYDRYHGNASDPQLQQELRERLMEVDLRTGFAFGGKEPKDPVSVFLRECGRIANRQMLLQTLENPEPTARLQLLNELEREDPANAQQNLNDALDKDLEQRVEIAKILFLTHLGRFQLLDPQHEPMEMNENIAEVYTHGGRTMFILPAGTDQTQVMNGIQGQHPEQSGLKGRSFATHSVTPRKLRADGSIESEATELRVTGLYTYSRTHHKGMNVSVGGLGQIGPNKKVITADGTNGHMYMHLVPGKENTCGTMLVGFENSGPGKKSRLGHAHTASAKKAGGSAFLSDKSYLGSEFGGRIVDLSGLSTEELSALLGQFENAYRNAAKADPGLLNACNDLLTGKMMSVGQLKGMLQELQVPKEQIRAVEPARAGHRAAEGCTPLVPEDHPAVAVPYAQQPKNRPPRVTQCEGLLPPTAPAVMKEPSLWDKLLHQLTFHSKNSYVSRYQEYLRTLPERMAAYRMELQEYRCTLEALERGENPNGLQEAYDRAVKRAEAVFGISAQEPAHSQTQTASPTSPPNAEQLENALLDMLFRDASPGNTTLKTTFRELIRQTEGFKKMIRSGEDNIASVLGDSEKMENIHADVSREILEKTAKNHAPQKNQAIVQQAPLKNGHSISGR